MNTAADPTIADDGLSLRQKNLLLLKAHEFLFDSTDIQLSLQILSKLLGLDFGMVQEYLANLYDLQAIQSAAAGGAYGDEVMKGGEVVNDVSAAVRSGPISVQVTPLKRHSHLEQVPITADELEEEAEEADGLDDGMEADEGQDEPGDEMAGEEGPQKTGRSRRVSSQAEIVITPVKRARRR